MRPLSPDNLSRKQLTKMDVALALFLLAGLFAPGVAGAIAGPVAVSPGTSRGPGIAIADRCPTFSWAGVPQAEGYELTVYRLEDGDHKAEPVFSHKVQGTASSWSPSLTQCLQSDGSYAWSVRAAREDGWSNWSEPSLFEVVARQEEAGPPDLPVRTALASKSSADSEAPSKQATPAQTASSLSGGPKPVAPPGTELSVDGNVDAVSFSGDGSLLTGLDPAALSAGTAGIDITGNAATATTATTATTAGDADKVDGFHAAASATPNTLLALDVLGYLPANAESATKLLVDGADCAADEAAGGVDSFGNAEECRDQADLTADGTNTRIGASALTASTGTQNTALGFQALQDNTTGVGNSAVGYKAMRENTTGGYNTATGRASLELNTTGAKNTATGNEALSANTTGVNNTGTGDKALGANTTGAHNTATGYAALRSSTTAARNSAHGSRALQTNTTGYRNTASGYGALRFNTTGRSNTAGGAYSMFLNTTGENNTALGALALRDNTGSNNTGLGNNAGHKATTGSDNIFIANDGVAGDDKKIKIGTQGNQTATHIAGIHGTPLVGSSVVVTATGQLGTASGATGNADTVDGFDASASATANTLLALDGTGKLPADITGNAATATTAGDADTVDGKEAADFIEETELASLGDLNTQLGTTIADGPHTVAHGDGTDCPADEAAGGVDASGNANVCRDQADLTGFGTNNTRVGTGALISNTTGFSNTGVGKDALGSNTSGDSNTATGADALRYNTTGTRNTAAGEWALRHNTAGGNNTAFGRWALRPNTTGSYNTATGSAALSANTSGHANTASGGTALPANTEGYRNSAFGFFSLRYNTTGDRNTAMGAFAGRNATTGDDNIFLGSGAEGVAGEANTIRIGGSAVGASAGKQNRAFINGIRGVTTGVADAISVMIDSAGQLGTVSSSRRYKEDIGDMGAASDRLLALRPVTFRYKKEFADGEKPIQFGLIAEEVAEVFPGLVVYNDDDEPETVKYHLLSTLLLNELQKQAVEIERLRTTAERLVAVEARLQELQDVEHRLLRLEATLTRPPRLAEHPGGATRGPSGAP